MLCSKRSSGHAQLCFTCGGRSSSGKIARNDRADAGISDCDPLDKLKEFAHFARIGAVQQIIAKITVEFGRRDLQNARQKMPRQRQDILAAFGQGGVRKTHPAMR